MAYNVRFEIPARKLGRADVTFIVKRNQSVLGTLGVSRGSVVWYPRGTNWGHKATWAEFSVVMKEHAKRFERR